MVVSNCTVSCGVFRGQIEMLLGYFKCGSSDSTFSATIAALHRAFKSYLLHGATPFSFRNVTMADGALLTNHLGAAWYLTLHKGTFSIMLPSAHGCYFCTSTSPREMISLINIFYYSKEDLQY